LSSRRRARASSEAQRPLVSMSISHSLETLPAAARDKSHKTRNPFSLYSLFPAACAFLCRMAITEVEIRNMIKRNNNEYSLIAFFSLSTAHAKDKDSKCRFRSNCKASLHLEFSFHRGNKVCLNTHQTFYRRLADLLVVDKRQAQKRTCRAVESGKLE